MSIPHLNLEAFAPELALSAGALLVLLVGAFRRTSAWGLVLGLTGILVAFVLWWHLPVTAWAFAGDYAGDGISYFARGFFLVVAFAMTILVASGESVPRQMRSEFLALLYISVLGMMVMASAQNWVIIFLGLETMSIPLYIMAAFYRTQRASLEAGVKYFIYGAFASAFFVYGIALLYMSAGTVDQLLLLESGSLDRLAAAGVALILVGLAFKIAVVPFHMWAPDAYAGAPTVVTSFFAVAPKAAGFVALWRLVTLSAELVVPGMDTLLAILAVMTIILGNLWALVQSRLKRMLAYSSIAHAGYLLLALVAYDYGGSAALLFYLVAYGIMTLGAFVVLLVMERDGGADTYDDISGGAGRRPLLALAMTIFMISLAGFPATAGFIGKLQIFKALLDGDRLALVIVAITGSLISVAYYLRVVVYLYMRPGPERARSTVPVTWSALAVVLAVAVLVLGILPDLLWPAIENWLGAGMVGTLVTLP